MHPSLSRWKLVIHGCIDEYSRIIYLKCVDNRADTVLSFAESVQHVGIPSRARADCGGENVMVASYM